MKRPAPPIWIDADEQVVQGNPADQGWVESEFGPDFLTLPGTHNYLERVTRIRVHVAACDGDFTKTFPTVELAGAYCKSMGFFGGGVTDHGTARFDGVSYRQGKSSAWRPAPRALELLVWSAPT